MKKIATGPTKRYVFYNSENPGVPQFFSKASLVRGVWSKTILHGATVELTDEQYRHIVQDCCRLDYPLVNNYETGQLIPGKVVKTPRFQLQPVL